MVDVRLQVPLVLGAERAVGAIEGGRLAALVQQVPLQYVRVLVALAAAGAIVPPIEPGPGDAADRPVIVVVIVIVVPAGMPRRTVEPGATLGRQRRRHVARGRPRHAPRPARAPAEAREETCKQSKQRFRRVD